MADKNVSITKNSIQKTIPETSITIVQIRDDYEQSFKTFIQCDNQFTLNSPIKVLYTSLLTLANVTGRTEVLKDVLEVYRHANENVDEEFLDNGITELASKYSPWAGKANATFSMLYLIMLDEIHMNYKLNKNLPLLGSYQVLTQGMTPDDAAVDTKVDYSSGDSQLIDQKIASNNAKVRAMKQKLAENHFDI